ncbi:family 78 glycoside hydrolase catalytic domain [Streptomyces sp. NBC_00388]|uniref:family 78 glycoside hydrolase catalytic domain n=1 Tax=Streptomyces sp. NBC_00388 TaxID=2975735 RepID=UPI002E2503E1
MSLRRWAQRPAWSTAVVPAVVAALVWGGAPFAPPARAAVGGPLSVTRPTVDGATDPLGTGDPAPGFGWQLRSAANGARQSAYRILVSDDTREPAPGHANVWDSGKVATDDSTAVPYGGPKLLSSHAYSWKVRVWDAHGTASAWSPTAHWETGLLAAGDWRGARWISPGAGPGRASSHLPQDEPAAAGTAQPEAGETTDGRPAAPMLRKSFALAGKRIVSARAYVYGLGFYELHLNGAKVGDHVLAPAATPYDRRNAYATYDVTDGLRHGANTVGLWLGNGYGPRFSPYGFRWTGPEQAVMLLRVRYGDGTEQDVTTDSSWRWSSGAITTDDLYAGESYDARLDRTGWDRPGYGAAGWQPVRTVAAPSDRLTADTTPPLRVTGTLRAVKLTEPRPGVYVYDFGQDIAGWERLRVRGPAGTRVRMRTAEEVGADGMLDTATNRAAAATDTYTLAGTGATESYEPRFTYHGFRYLEVTGFPGKPPADAVEARVVHADVASTGSFSSSDPLLDRIWQNNRWSILNNSMSLPTDNPVRDERTPPGMDVQAYRDASTREFGMDSFYAAYLQDMPPGTALPNDAGNAQQPDMGGDQIGLAWTLYEQYGDRAALAAAYPAMKTFADTNAADVPGHIWPADRGFGDWCPPDRSAAADGGQGGPDAGDCTSEVSLVNTALSYLQARDVARSARALGHGSDAARYWALAADIKDAFNAAFLNAAGDTYGDGRQTTSVLPLAFGMVPAADADKVGRRLVDTVLTADGGHLDTGIFGTRYLMDALAAVGRTDVAMTVLDQRDYPGFGYEIGRGATSSWEQWTYSSAMETHDHAMFAGINASLYTELGGIEPTGPGYRTLKVDPRIPAGLRHAAVSQDTVRGRVATSWTVTGGRLSLDVTVPVGSTATVVVPHSGSRGAHAPEGAKLRRDEGGRAAYTVGSGRWHFTGTGPATPPRPARR